MILTSIFFVIPIRFYCETTNLKRTSDDRTDEAGAVQRTVSDVLLVLSLCVIAFYNVHRQQFTRQNRWNEGNSPVTQGSQGFTKLEVP